MLLRSTLCYPSSHLVYKFVIRSYSVLKSYRSVLFRPTRIYSIVSDSNPFGARYIYPFAVGSAKFSVQIALHIWKSNFCFINACYFSMEQKQVLSTLNIMNISFLQMVVEAEQQREKKEQE